jgi:hypothetical protein
VASALGFGVGAASSPVQPVRTTAKQNSIIQVNNCFIVLDSSKSYSFEWGDGPHLGPSLSVSESRRHEVYSRKFEISANLFETEITAPNANIAKMSEAE